MSQVIYDANTGTTITFDPKRIFLVDVTDEDFAHALDDEDPDAQHEAEQQGTSLADLLPALSDREVIDIFPEDIRSGDIIVEAGQHLLVEDNDGPSSTIPGTHRIENAFCTAYLDDELSVSVIRDDT